MEQLVQSTFSRTTLSMRPRLKWYLQQVLTFCTNIFHFWQIQYPAPVFHSAQTFFWSNVSITSFFICSFCISFVLPPSSSDNSMKHFWNTWHIHRGNAYITSSPSSSNVQRPQHGEQITHLYSPQIQTEKPNHIMETHTTYKETSNLISQPQQHSNNTHHTTQPARQQRMHETKHVAHLSLHLPGRRPGAYAPLNYK